MDLPEVLVGVSNFPLIARDSKRAAEIILRDKNPQPRLTTDQATAIAAYTYDLGVNSKSDGRDNLFVVLNNVLRERSSKKISKMRNYLTFLMSGLATLPPVKKKVFRGVPRAALTIVEDTSKYGLGKSVHWSAFTSTTTNKQKAKQFAQGPGGVIFRLAIVNGRSIHAYSIFGFSEEEVLLSPNTCLVVSRECHKKDDGFYYVKLVEKTDGGIIF